MTSTMIPTTVPADGQRDTVEIVDVTPAVAGDYLTHNTHNRNVKPTAIARFVADMLAGEWQWTGEPIRFAIDGTLIDGQNRLHAIVESGTTQKMLVIRGLPMETQRDIDTGTPRRLHDVLKLRGEVNASSLAALVRAVESWESGARRSIGHGNAAHSRCLRSLDAHPELRDLVQPSRTVASGCGLPAAICGLAWWVFRQIDYDDAEFFFSRLGDGQSLVKGDPIYELRRTLQESKSVRGERNRTWMLAITIKSWNAYRNGDTVGLFRWRPGGAKPEAFPEPI